MHHSFDQRICFKVIFFLSKRTAFCSKYNFFVKLSYILSQLLLSWAEVWKCTLTILMENCGQAICLGLSILFLYATSDKVWLFEKFIFELEAFWDHSKFNSVEILQLRDKFQTAMVSYSRFIWITNSSDHRRVWAANFLHKK